MASYARAHASLLHAHPGLQPKPLCRSPESRRTRTPRRIVEASIALAYFVADILNQAWQLQSKHLRSSALGSALESHTRQRKDMKTVAGQLLKLSPLGLKRIYSIVGDKAPREVPRE
jgi:hypothetical protein